MRGHERDGQCPSGEQHREVLHSCADGKEFRLSRKLKAGGLCARLMDGAGDDGVDLARQRHAGALLQRFHCGPGGFYGRNSRRRTPSFPDHAIFKAPVQFSRREGGADNFRADSRAIAEGDADDSRTASRVQVSKS